MEAFCQKMSKRKIAKNNQSEEQCPWQVNTPCCVLNAAVGGQKAFQNVVKTSRLYCSLRFNTFPPHFRIFVRGPISICLLIYFNVIKNI